MSAWSLSDIPDQTGRVAIVTGANAGIGLETARALAQKGAHVVLACRNPAKGEAALADIVAQSAPGGAELRALDLADLDSVRAFAAGVRADLGRLDLLINNAGVMNPPFSRTKQGFELQFGTNHLGHFALTGLLLPLLDATPGARVVVVYSSVHWFGRIDFDDPNYARRPYRDALAYSQSKLANLLFAAELHRRLAAAGSHTVVTAAHPGWTATDLQRTSPTTSFLNRYFAMKPADGALPTLRAATDPIAAAGSHWGPAGFGELNGPPAPGRISARAKDMEAAARLWTLSESLTGVAYPAATSAAA